MLRRVRDGCAVVRSLLRISWPLARHANILPVMTVFVAPAIERAIQERNPWTDVLNVIQIECLKRQRDGDDDPQLNTTLQAAVNGIAAAMQSTG